MDFFAHQAKARSQSRRLLIWFGLAVLGVVLAIDAVMLVVLISIGRSGKGVAPISATPVADHLGGLIATSLVVLTVIVIASMVKIAMLRSGGSAVARKLGAVRVNTGGSDLALRRLRNVVEEIAIASGVPVPEIYVLEQEESINAFAAGFSPADAAVCVTRGCLEKLNRDELQGVIAHEFSHVLNGDMRLNIRMMGLLFGILVIGIAGREMLRIRSGDKEGMALMLIALAVMIVGYAGLFFGRIIKASVSRQREYLADASAVQFTRQTVGISGALKKIAALPAGSRLTAGDGEEVSHMLFGDGMGFSALFATHPPVLERIQRLDPRFKEAELIDLSKRWSRVTTALADDDSPSAPLASFAGIETAPAAVSPATAPKAGPPRVAPPASMPAAGSSVSVDPHRVARQVGNPSSDDYAAAGSIHQNLPEALAQLAYMQEQAPALVLALALDRDAGLRERQLQIITDALGHDLAQRARAIVPSLVDLHPLHRLPLASLAFPTLRRRPRPYLENLVRALDGVIRADGHVQLGEYCLARLLGVQVMDALDPSRSVPLGSKRLVDVRAAVVDLFAVLAQHGHGDADQARRAFIAGTHLVLGTDVPTYQPSGDWQQALDRAFAQLNRLNPAGKQLLVEGLTRTLSLDNRVTLEEAELLRTICAALHCPLPPILSV